jgi:hypothetical protein
MTELKQVVIVTKQGEPYLVFRSPNRAKEFVKMANRLTPDEPYRLNLFAIAG